MTEPGRLLQPQSIAIVGVSADPAKHGHRVLANLRRLGFAGAIWGVNPKLPEIAGLDVYAALEELPAAPDVVVSAVPGAAVPAVAAAAAEQSAGAVIVFAGGFAEAGAAGDRLQKELAAAVDGSATRVLGPNSGGVIVPSAGLAASFLTCLDRPAAEIRSGAVGLVTQSGGTGSYIHNLAAAAGGGLAASISTGNEADFDVADGIQALVGLEEVRAIALVLETVRDGPRFIDAVGAARAAGKPVVVCHLGRSVHSAGMLATHTGALATDRRVFAGVSDSLGIALAATPGEMLEVAEVMARATRAEGSRIGVVTHSGGVAILLADLFAGTACELPQPSPEIAAELDPLLDLGTPSNPLDMGAIIGGPHRFAEVVEIFARTHDVVLAVSSAHPPAHSAQRAEVLVGLERRPPIVHLWMAGDVSSGGEQILREADLPVASEPRAAVAAVDGLVRFARADVAVTRPDARRSPRSVVTLSEHDSKSWLTERGIPAVAGGLATTAAEAATIAAELGGPVVVKISSPDIVHKAAAGGVRSGIADAAAAARAFDEVTAAVRAAAPEARFEGARVEREASGIETIAAAVWHPTFGPLVSVGRGGSGVEAEADVAMALAPLSAGHVRRLIDGLRGAEALEGDREQLAWIVVKLGELLAGGAAVEIEINPLAWTGTAWLALDAVVRLSPGAGE